MPYKIVIWVDSLGIPYIGAIRKDWKKLAVDYERVFGTQIGHRVVATTPDGYRIITPSEANKHNYPVRHFTGPRR
jgi:hypothetical protein